MYYYSDFSTSPTTGVQGTAVPPVTEVVWGPGGNITGLPTYLTDGRVELGLNSSGVLLTNIPVALANSSNLLRYTGGGLFTGALNATAGADWTTNVSNRPTHLTDSRITTALNSSGILQTNIPLALADSSNLLRRTGGGLFSGALDATYGARLNLNLYRADGTTVLSESEVITSLGIAQNITGSLSPHQVPAQEPGNTVLDDAFASPLWSIQAIASLDTTTETTVTLSAVRSVKTQTGNGTTLQTAGVLASINNPTKYSPVTPGNTYRVHARTLLKSGFTGRLRCLVSFVKPDGTTVSSSSIFGRDCRAVGQAAPSTMIDTILGIVTVPDGASHMNFVGYIDWSTVQNNAAYALFAKPSIKRASNDVYANTDASATIATATTRTTVQTANITTGGNPVTISSNFYLWAQHTGAFTFTLVVERVTNSVATDVYTTTVPSPPSNYIIGHVPTIYKDTPPAGTHTYNIRIVFNVTPFTTLNYRSRTLLLEEGI